MCKFRQVTNKLIKKKKAVKGLKFSLWVIRNSLHIDKIHKINFIPIIK